MEGKLWESMGKVKEASLFTEKLDGRLAIEVGRLKVADQVVASGSTDALARAMVPTLLGRTSQEERPGVVEQVKAWIEAERRYRLKFYPPLDLTGDVAEDTQRVQSAVERAVREYPDQWLWIHRRWKTRPPGAPALYN